MLLSVNMHVYLTLFIFALIDHVTAAMPKFVFAHFIVSGNYNHKHRPTQR